MITDATVGFDPNRCRLAVVDLHQPTRPDEDGWSDCDTCCVVWPCMTFLAATQHEASA